MDPAVVGVFIPIAFFVALAIVIWLVAYFRFRTRSDMQQTVRLALEKGTELGPEVLERLSGPKPDQNKDIRTPLSGLPVPSEPRVSALESARKRAKLSRSFWAYQHFHSRSESAISLSGVSEETRARRAQFR